MDGSHLANGNAGSTSDSASRSVREAENLERTTTVAVTVDGETRFLLLTLAEVAQIKKVREMDLINWAIGSLWMDVEACFVGESGE